MNPCDWSPRQLIGVRAILTFVVAFMVAGQVHAGTITTTVKAPAKYTDGTAIDAPIKYRLEGSYDGQPTIVVTSDTTTFRLTDMPAGHWCNRVFSVVNGVDGDPSDQACTTVPPASTPPPTVKKPNPAYGIQTTATP